VILVDTSLWVDHLRLANPTLEFLLQQRQVLCHPFVVGEVAMGSLRHRHSLLQMMDELPCAWVGSDGEVRRFVEKHSLFASGVGYIDAHLLVAVRLTPDGLLWTRDKRLHKVAADMSIAFQEGT
jgi:predicted nucleic acid-binding protein